jgi:CheY-like chemotaxis protein
MSELCMYNSAKTSKHLICDDSTYNRLVLKRYLAVLSIEVDEASSGEEALRLVQANGEYAIIWMDIRMGANMNGTHCTRSLRQMMDYQGKIIALTGYVDESTYEDCMTSGIDHFLSKPFNRESVSMYSKRYKHASTAAPSSPPIRSSIAVMENSDVDKGVQTPKKARRHTFFSYVSKK